MLKRIESELIKLGEAKNLRELHVRTARVPGSITIRGKKLIDFTNWDSLNLNADPKFISSFQREAEISGVGSMASRASSGTLPAHFSLERRLADFFGVESALLFSSANQVVLSVVSALLGEGDCVIVDESSHGRVVDAATLVNAETINFDNSNPDSLARAIEQSKPYKNKLIVSESISPLTGDLLNFKVVSELTAKANISWVIDESYGLGVTGLRGAGILDGVEIPKNLLARFGSMAFGLGGYGAFIAGPKSLTDYLVNRSRTFVTEPAMPPALAAAIETALGIIELDHGKRLRLKELALRFRESLNGAGFKVPLLSDSPIVSIKIGKRSTVQELNEGLFQRGILAEVITSGNRLDTGAILRFIINAAHKERELDDTMNALTELHKRVLKS